MVLAKFRQEESTRVNYLCIDRENKLVGFSIDIDGIKPFQKELLEQFYEAIHINENCIEILDEGEYSVFYNPVTKFKHYVKNGKEDMEMFFLNNGVDAVMIEENDNKKKGKSTAFVKALQVVQLGLLVMSMVNLLNNGLLEDIVDIYEYNNSDLYSVAGDTVFSGNMLSTDAAIELICGSSYLSVDDKAFLSNKDLLNDILPYYEGRFMEADIKMRLNRVRVEYYDKYDSLYDEAEGYYNTLDSSVLKLHEKYQDVAEDDIDRRKVLAHEFIHMLQADIYKYKYLRESCAELMSVEYFDFEGPDSYVNGVTTLKLLIDIIGPEPILKTVFGGDMADLEEILKNNLNDDEYDKLTDYMQKSPSDTNENEEEIRGLLCTLYKNMYGRDISEDPNIFYDIFYKDSENYLKYLSRGEDTRIFLNKSRMSDNQVLIFDVNYLTDQENCAWMVTSKTKESIRRDVDVDEYMASYNKEGYLFDLPENAYISDGYVYFYESVSVNEEGHVVYEGLLNITSIDDAVRTGYVVPYLASSIDIGENVPEGWKYNLSPEGTPWYTSERISNVPNSVIEHSKLIVDIEGIKERFGVRTFGNEINEEKGHKAIM